MKKKSRFSKLLLYMKPFIGLSIFSAVISTLVASGNAAPAWLVQYLIDDVLVNKDQKMLLLVCVGMLTVTILKGFGSFYRIYIQSYISGRMIRNMREDLYKKVISSSHNFFHEMKIGDILTRFSSDLVMVQGVVESSFKLLIELIYVFLLLTRLFYLDWKLSMVCIIVVPLSGRLIRKFVKKLRKTGKGIQESLAELNTRLQEVLNGINVIKSFATEDYEFDKFKVKSDENYKLTLKNRKTNAKIRPLMEFFNILTVTIVAYYGGLLVIKGSMTPGELLSFLTALGLLSTPIKKMTQIVGEIQTKSHSIDRIYDVLENEDYIKEKSDAKELKEVMGEIHLNNLNFSYPSEENLVLKNINLDIKAGEMIAFVGKSGSGKSTLVSLIPRFYDINSGTIKIDDVDIKDLTIKSLRKNIGIVPQETVLFSGTIYENISYGTINISKEKVVEAAKMANAYNFINELPNGFETEVGEKGLKLSGGQKQRIAIARALIQNPKILILDEATSALDTESEKLVQNALDKLMEKRTSLVIAHRLSTILHADKIVVMEDGEIREFGTNEELLKRDGIYRKLYDTQFENV